MKKLTDQFLATRLLETRQRGFTFGLFLCRAARQYLMLLAIFATALFVLFLLEIWPLFWVLLGMLLGSVLRDLGWVKSIRRTWPFSEQVTDWTKVQALAEGKTLN